MVFFFQALIVVAVSLTCYFFASRCENLNRFFLLLNIFFRVNVFCSNLPFFRYRRFMVSSRDSLIERPVDLLQELRGGGGGGGQEEEEVEGKKKQ